MVGDERLRRRRDPRARYQLDSLFITHFTLMCKVDGRTPNDGTMAAYVASRKACERFPW